MIKAEELRLGNYILQKQLTRIVRVKCDYTHFDLLSKGDAAGLFPVVLKADILEKCGFEENKKYANYPESREFILTLPVIGSNKNEIYGYIKNNGECFARAVVNGSIASNHVYQLHQLQNLVFALTGHELVLNEK